MVAGSPPRCPRSVILVDRAAKVALRYGGLGKEWHIWRNGGTPTVPVHRNGIHRSRYSTSAIQRASPLRDRASLPNSPHTGQIRSTYVTIALLSLNRRARLAGFFAPTVCRKGCSMRRCMIVTSLLLVLVLGPTKLDADGPPRPVIAIPSAVEVADMLRREPVTLATWPTWKARLLNWIDDRTSQTDAAYTAAANFVETQVVAPDALQVPLADDSFAWYMLGRAHRYKSHNGNFAEAVSAAERAYRKSILLDPRFARAHRNLALVLMIQDSTGDEKSPRNIEALQELKVARELEPGLSVKTIAAQAALERKDFARAEKLFAAIWAEDPAEPGVSLGLASVILSNEQRSGSKPKAIEPLVRREPDNGTLACLYGVALAMDNDPRSAVAQFERARSLGVDPKAVLAPQLVDAVEQAAQPGLIERFGWTMLYVTAFYGAVIALMAASGWILAGWTRGQGALQLLSDEPVEVVARGQVVRAAGEPLLARVYAVALVFGLVLFYIALPFVAVGLVGATLGVLWLVFQAGRVPIKLVVIIVFIGVAMVWAVLKSMFARMGTGSFGLLKTAEQCPRLYAALQDVAQRVDTQPVDDVYIAPGSEIGVHQEGRGPFGIFGTKRRVLTLGLSIMHSLTVDELKSILAHEYAHFSHQDTFYSRFIHRVDLSIHTALSGMGAAGGRLNYVNPFFWFLVLYFRAYSLLSAGFSRSREFLADRMACSLYGANVFGSALTKVCTEGPLFEMSVYASVANLLSEQKAFVNVYEAFGNYRKEDASAEHRDRIRNDLDNERGSLFASHPTYRERLEASAAWPNAQKADEAPAIQLFDDPEAMERELTEFLTGAIHYAHQQAAAAVES